MSSPIMNTYARLNVGFVRGEGAWLVDTEGKRYLDALAGIGVVALGHAHPAVVRAITEQAARVMHTSNLYEIPLQQKLAEALTRISGMDSVFFANSGAEANECAIKMSRIHGHKRDIDDPAVVVAEASFHGRTLATLTATGNRKVQAGFEPLVNGFVRAPYNDVEALAKIATNKSNVAAILIEPIQGEGGIQIPAPDYLAKVREICDREDWLMILDEVQSGNGRTGKYFAYQHSDILPDVVTTAKGLGNGFPIGACLARGAAAELFKPGNHATTFGGSPLACATALAVVETIEKEGLVERAGIIGARMLKAFTERLSGSNRVKQVRGKGLMIGIELSDPCPDMVRMALERGLLLNVTVEKVVRLLPPLIISDDEADQIVDTVCGLIEDL